MRVSGYSDATPMRTPCDVLLTNAHVLTMDERFTSYEGGSIAIAGSTILAVGEHRRPTTRPTQTIDCAGRVVMPGLVNAHTHAPMTLLRGLADDLRLDVWLMGYMMPVERQFVRPDFVALGTKLACAEMIRSGTTCFADMYYFEEAVAEATAAVGLRALCAQTVLKFPAPDAASFEDSLARAREFITDWKGHPVDRAGGCTARAVHLHGGDPQSVCRAAPASSTCRFIPTCPKRRSRSNSPGASTACRSCRG